MAIINKEDIIEIEAIEKALSETQKTVKILVADLTKLVGQFNALNAEGKETVAVEKEAATTRKKINDGTAEAIRLNNEYNAKLKVWNDAQREQVKIQELTIKANKAAKGSYEQMSAQYALNKIALSKMSAEQLKTDKAAKDLLKTTNKLHAEMEKYQKSTGNGALAVGKYKEGIINAAKSVLAFTGITIGITAAFNGFKAVMNSTDEGADKLAATTRGLQTAFDFLKRSVYDLNFKDFAAGLKAAYNEGKRFEGVEDSIADNARSLGYFTAENIQKITELEEAFKNQNLSVKERLKNGLELKKILIEESQAHSINASSSYKNQLQSIQQITGATEEEILAFNKKRDVYKKIYAETVKLGEQEQQNNDDLAKSADQLGSAFVGMSEETINSFKDINTNGVSISKDVFDKLSKISDTSYDELLKRFTEMKTAQNSAYNENKKIFNGINSLQAEANNKAREQREKNKEEEKKAKAQEITYLEELNKLKLSEFDKSVDQTNKSFAYEQKIAAERFELEWTLQYELLQLKKKNGALTEEQYKSEFNNLITLQNKFEQTQTENAFKYAQEREQRKKEIAEGFGLTGEIKQDKKKRTIWGLMGLDDEETKRAKANTGVAMDAFNKITDSASEYYQNQINQIDELINKRKEETDNLKTKLQEQEDRREKGLANNVESARRNYEKMQRLEEQAQKKKERLVKKQQQVESIQQMVNMGTASAELIKSAYEIGGVWGTVIAAVGLAAMWGMWANAKIKARQSSKYGKGGVEKIKGGSHASGNDVHIGETVDGRQMIGEGEELMSVFSRPASSMYEKDIREFTNAANAGNLNKYLMGRAIRMNLINSNENPYMKKMSKSLEDIKKQGDERIYTDSKGRMVYKYKGVTRYYV